jgi:hypothetical protein
MVVGISLPIQRQKKIVWITSLPLLTVNISVALVMLL